MDRWQSIRTESAKLSVQLDVMTLLRWGASASSFSNDFHEDTFSTQLVEFAEENLFPGTEVEFALGDGDDDLATHDLPFQVRVGVVFAGAVVPVILTHTITNDTLNLLEGFPSVRREQVLAVLEVFRTELLTPA